jgi:hypothetical protein
VKNLARDAVAEEQRDQAATGGIYTMVTYSAPSPGWRRFAKTGHGDDENVENFMTAYFLFGERGAVTHREEEDEEGRIPSKPGRPVPRSCHGREHHDVGLYLRVMSRLHDDGTGSSTVCVGTCSRWTADRIGR